MSLSFATIDFSQIVICTDNNLDLLHEQEFQWAIARW